MSFIYDVIDVSLRRTITWHGPKNSLALNEKANLTTCKDSTSYHKHKNKFLAYQKGSVTLPSPHKSITPC